jgi:hypothetical protein
MSPEHGRFTAETQRHRADKKDEARHIRLLRLMQLSDSALPTGAMNHSFGIETLVANELLSVDRLEELFGG